MADEPAIEDRSYLSIGEVLQLLKAEFPDVTISKIRFLESQGLIDPERTASGYRKFYGGDVSRLRWILQQQKDHFLPLKVIRDRLAAGAADAPPPDLPAAVTTPEATATERADREPTAAGPDAWPAGAPVGTTAGEQGAATGPDDGVGADDGAAAATTPGSTALGAHAGGAAPGGEVAPVATGVPVDLDRPAEVLDLDLTSEVPPASADPSRGGTGGPLSTGLTAASLSAGELCRASGLDAGQLADLERYGLLAPRTVDGEGRYDEDALIVARLAAGFARHGVEPRHLRMIRTAADREAGLYEQLVLPMSNRRHDPAARRRTVETLDDLVRLGSGLRSALLRQALRNHLRDGA